jgi:hypothetical protein
MKNITVNSTQLLVSTVQQLSLARDMNTVMKIVRTAARQLTGADGATFVLRENDKCYYADEDAIMPLWKGSRFPIEACVSGWAMLNSKPIVIKDIYADKRIPADAYHPTFVKSLVMVPIRTADPVGAIGNYWAAQRQPEESEIWLLQSLADITAVTIENVKVYTELEKRVKERTLQLEQINKELEAFSYSVSHDLRAPLRAIGAYTDFLLESNGSRLNEEGHELSKKLINSVGRMNTLIDDMLHFFKTDKKQLARSSFDMNKLVQQVVTQLQEQEKQRQINFIIDELPSIKADPSLIKQVWINLVGNAIKYTGQKEKAVIHIGAENNENDTVYFIKDNGAGFDMKYADKLFGVFQRLHAANDFEGTGVGLATVQRIVSRHGGKIWAEAKPEEGATFYFSLEGIENLDMLKS